VVDTLPEIILRGQGGEEIAPHGQGNVYAPHVLIEDGLFRMWYGGQGKDGHDRISYAESKDGKKWVRKDVVLKDDTANHVNDPSVVKVNGRYFMYYTCAKKDVVDRIDVAISQDGRQWERKGVVVNYEELFSWPAERIAQWREQGGQTYLDADQIVKVADEMGFQPVPLLFDLDASRLPTDLEEAHRFLLGFPSSHCKLDEGAAGIPEGIVVRSPDRSRIAKLRREDYERTLKRRQGRR
jgi:hypothetical protein